MTYAETEGLEYEIEFLKFMLGNSNVLKLLKVTCGTLLKELDEEELFYAELTLLPRSSRDCRIHFVRVVHNIQVVCLCETTIAFTMRLSMMRAISLAAYNFVLGSLTFYASILSWLVLGIIMVVVTIKVLWNLISFFYIIYTWIILVCLQSDCRTY